MAWIPFRELLLAVATTPALLLPLLALLGLLFLSLAGLAWPWRALLSGLLVALASLLHSPLATTALTAWLTSQLPAPATTTLAARLLAEGRVNRIYISGDTPPTAQRLLDLGVSPQRIAGDSCARTTWENASQTTAWIRQHLPASTPVLLITDPWQLPRATRAFAQQHLPVTPLAAEPQLPPNDQGSGVRSHSTLPARPM